MAEPTSYFPARLRTEQSVSPSASISTARRNWALSSGLVQVASTLAMDPALGTEVPLFCTQNPGNLIATRATLDKPESEETRNEIPADNYCGCSGWRGVRGHPPSCARTRYNQDCLYRSPVRPIRAGR